MPSPSLIISRLGLLAASLMLLTSTGCMYNGHRTMGATEKIAASDVNYFAKIGGVVVMSFGDSVLAPVEMAADLLTMDHQYHPDHRYLSYAGSRTIARSDMGLGYQWMSSIWSLVVETIYLPVTGTLDLCYVLFAGRDTPPPTEAEMLLAGN